MDTFEKLENEICFLFHLKKATNTTHDRLLYMQKKQEFFNKFHANREKLTSRQILNIYELLELKRI